MPTNRRISNGGGNTHSFPKAKKPRGISNKQAKKLAQLQRALGKPYSGQGMTAVAASKAIDDALVQLGRRPKSRAALKKSRRINRRAQRQSVEMGQPRM